MRNNNKDAKFIYTVSKESADILKQNGLVTVYEGGGFWVFINDKKINFDKLDHITFSNNYYG